MKKKTEKRKAKRRRWQVCQGKQMQPGRGVTQKVVFVAQSADAREDPEAAPGLKQKLDCSQVEEECEEGEMMDWLEVDEMMRQREEVSKEDEKITVRKMEGRSLQHEAVQKAPEILVSQVLTKE